jgi:hypothetical protein
MTVRRSTCDNSSQVVTLALSLLRLRYLGGLVSLVEPTQMIGTSLPEYVFIRTSITLLRLVAPISFIYVAYLLAAWPAARWQALLGGYAVVEVLFYTLVYLPRRFSLQTVRFHLYSLCA